MRRLPEPENEAMDNALWCLQHGIAVYRVADVYDTDESGTPIPDADRCKWFVSVLAGSFPEDVVKNIPFADTQAEAEANAVAYLWAHVPAANGNDGQEEAAAIQ